MSFFTNIPPVPDWSFTPSIDFRERYERRTDKDFSASHIDNRSDLYQRWRAGGTFSIGKKLTARGMYQYASDLSWTRAANTGPQTSDLYEGWIDLKLTDGHLRIGRQEFIKGDKRLFDQGEWGNAGRTWDMVRYSDKQWDVWAGRLALNSVPSKEGKLTGASYKGPYGETMLFFKHNDLFGLKDDIYTLDHHWTRKAKRWTGEFEAAGQLGRQAGQPMRAWAGEARASYQANPKTALYAEIDAASGGHHGNTSFTFDQTFPGNHNKYGIMDMQGWRNMKGITLGATYQATRNTTFTLEYDHFGLWAADDAWYGDNGKPNKGSGFTFSDPTGAKGTDIGQEIDLSGCLKIDKQSTLDAGIGVFMPGHFVRSFANTGDHQVWGYVQYRVRF